MPTLAAGIDEAGRGCLAGPVVAAVVILPRAYDLPGLTDSKKLTAARREVLAAAIVIQAKAWCLGYSWPREIEVVNIYQATRQAMRRAVLGLKSPPARLVIDGTQTVALPIPQKTVIKGDLTVPVISAASILAKVFRDRLMLKLDARYPGYGLAAHKGYGTTEHLEAVARLGPSRIHRNTFRGVRAEPPETAEDLWLPGISR